MKRTNTWHFSKTDVFWGKVASREHVLHLYENDDAFLDMLVGFVGAGINADDAVVIIADEAHLEGLQSRLSNHGIFMDSLIEENRYIPLRADEVLKEFMVDGMPDETLFKKTIGRVIRMAKRNGRKVRAFGEMVAILWSDGNKKATARLEELWEQYCAQENLTLFCAYPRNIFIQNAGEEAMHICSCHSRMLYETNKPLTDILYEHINPQNHLRAL